MSETVLAVLAALLPPLVIVLAVGAAVCYLVGGIIWWRNARPTIPFGVRLPIYRKLQVVVRSDDPALQERPDTLDGVGMDVALDPFVATVSDGAVIVAALPEAHVVLVAHCGADPMAEIPRGLVRDAEHPDGRRVWS